MIFRAIVTLVVGTLFSIGSSLGQIPHPKDEFGFMPGDDYKLVRFDQLISYYQTLSEASDRVILRTIGRSVDGLPMPLLIISDEENLTQLDRWQSISASLALPCSHELDLAMEILFRILFGTWNLLLPFLLPFGVLYQLYLRR